MNNGIFSPDIFSNRVFDTGASHKKKPEEHDDTRDRLLKEDEEILTIILAITEDV